MKNTLTEKDILYFYDGPMLVTLHDGKDLWLAVATASSGIDAVYRAARVEDIEIRSCTEGRMSLRGALAGKPAREVVRRGTSYSFTGSNEIVFPKEDLPESGIGIRPHMKDLPDRIPDPEEDPEALKAFHARLVPFLGDRDGVEIMGDPPGIEAGMKAVFQSYGWILDTDGRVHALVSGDMGFAPTHIVLDREDIIATAEMLIEAGYEKKT